MVFDRPSVISPNDFLFSTGGTTVAPGFDRVRTKKPREPFSLMSSPALAA
jgi:hypothetical protein